ncbi:nephrin-like isoform X2 [Aphis gossypii]|uniref:nephrin-like isoform X2 n=1 Tax=Aphis gossypii TaxID=80765 RepID=UPI0021599806|nr:nephrin-like isoform X2 [Aphis gossypii]
MLRCSHRTCGGRRNRRNPLRSLPQIGLLLLLFSCLRVTTFKQQEFRVVPQNVSAREGTNVTLVCEINDITGDVQWTKDGLALGYAAEIPGHPRHSMVIDAGNGVYNLLVRNVTITDDALYQCQVSPGPAAGSKPIRSSATLSVQIPPSSVEIINKSEDSKLEVQENHEVTIECIARNSKPASRIVWFRGDEEINPERSDNINEETAGETKLKLYTVRSRIKITAKSNDNNVIYKCEAHHIALSKATPEKLEKLSPTVQIRVLYPPGAPHIDGYNEGDILEKGTHVSLHCESKAGNPPAQLTWFKNDQMIHKVYSTTEKKSESTYSFTANVSDNNARFRCEAKNSISPLPQYADVVLSVSFGPSHVRIKGPVEAKQGELITLSCETGRSNPASMIKWMVNGDVEENSTFVKMNAPQSSFISKSNVSFVIPTGQRYVEATCQSIGNSISEKVISTHKINILHPPGAPIIIDQSSGNPIPSGNTHRISCVSTGGNPLGTITWFKNDKKVQPSHTTNGENSVSSELEFVVNYMDNDATYKCEVTHPALTVPLMKTQKLKVLFLPDQLNIKHEPMHLKPGVQATLTCEATSSNPPVKMKWWHQNLQVTEDVYSFTKPGLYGGKLSTIQLTINITSEMDGRMYKCQAYNSPMSKSLNKDVTLNVYHKPTFDSYPDLITYTEGDNIFITLQAKGQPSQITYKWLKNNKPLYSIHNRRVQDSNINITGVFRDDAGNYTCEASNTEGSSTIWFIISVKHRATITNTSSGVIVSQGDDALLWCQIDGYPLGPDHISWTRPNFFFDERTSILLKNTTSYLTILNATQFDSGLFYCVVNNGIGNESSHSVMLIVEHKPEILTMENESKTASNAGMSAKLHCRAVGAPMIRFSWERDGSNITSIPDKYIVEQRQLNETFYESTLTILQVDQYNYGDYVCTASNKLGRTTSVNRLTVFSHPDPPYNFRLANVTHNKVMLTWTPGFDGGEPVKYRIRFRPIENKNYRVEELGNETHHTISGLEPLTSYLFSILAHNMYGESSYVSQSLKVTTTKENMQPKPDSNQEKPVDDQGMRIVFTFLGVFGGILILISIFIVSYCIHRRRNVNKQMNNENNDSSSKTPTIEMYAPNTYNGYDENLSSISAKSETYSNVSPDYNDDQQQKSAEQSYLIEQIDYPFINDCDHPLQPHVQYGGGLSMSSDQSMQHYNMHENTNDRRNIENRTSHLHHHHHLHHLHHPQQHQQQQQKQHQHHHHPQQQHQQHQQPYHVVQGVPTARAVPLPPILHNRPVPPPTIPPMVSKLNYYSPPPPPPPPPDVTVFSSQNVLSTFAHKPDETEGHLV